MQTLVRGGGTTHRQVGPVGRIQEVLVLNGETGASRPRQVAQLQLFAHLRGMSECGPHLPLIHLEHLSQSGEVPHVIDRVLDAVDGAVLQRRERWEGPRAGRPAATLASLLLASFTTLGSGLSWPTSSGTVIMAYVPA